MANKECQWSGRNEDEKTCDIMYYDKDGSVDEWLVCFLNFVWLVSHKPASIHDYSMSPMFQLQLF